MRRRCRCKRDGKLYKKESKEDNVNPGTMGKKEIGKQTGTVCVEGEREREIVCTMPRTQNSKCGRGANSRFAVKLRYF